MIVVTAPTSNIGRQVIARLAAGSERIRAIARDPGRLPPETRDRVEVVVGSHSQHDVVDRAFDGADAVFWLVPADPRAASAEAAYVDFARPGCAAFTHRGVRRVVGISALGRGWPRDAGLVSATLKMDDMIADSGVGYRALACPSFMDNVLRQVASIRERGVIAAPLPGDLRQPTCATRDIAAVAAQWLEDPSWSGVAAVPILGPEALSGNEMAAIIAEVLATPIRFAEMSVGALRAAFLSRGGSEAMAQAMVNMAVAKSEGLDLMVPRTASTSSPTTFREWCEHVLTAAVAGQPTADASKPR